MFATGLDFGTAIATYYEVDYRAQRRESPHDRGYERDAWTRANAQYEYVIEQLKPERALAVFEVGCASGTLLRVFEDEGHSVAGCDPDRAMSAFARDEFGLDVRTAIFGDVDSALRNDCDLLLASHVLEHLTDPIAELRAMRDALAETGVLFVEVPNDDVSKVVAMSEAGYTSAHLSFFNVDSLTRTVTAAGFRVFDCHTSGPPVTALRANRMRRWLSRVPGLRAVRTRLRRGVRGPDTYSHPVEAFTNTDPGREQRVALRLLARRVELDPSRTQE